MLKKNLPHRIPGSHFISVNHRCDLQGLIRSDTFKTITRDLQLRRRPCIGAGIKCHPPVGIHVIQPKAVHIATVRGIHPSMDSLAKQESATQRGGEVHL